MHKEINKWVQYFRRGIFTFGWWCLLVLFSLPHSSFIHVHSALLHYFTNRCVWLTCSCALSTPLPPLPSYYCLILRIVFDWKSGRKLRYVHSIHILLHSFFLHFHFFISFSQRREEKSSHRRMHESITHTMVNMRKKQQSFGGRFSAGEFLSLYISVCVDLFE